MSQSTATETGDYPCTYGCGRRFDTPKQRSMHQIRMHTHKAAADAAGRGGGQPSHKQPRPRQSEEDRLAKKRAYNQRYRARIKRGLPGAFVRHGGFVPTSRSKASKASYYRNAKKRFAALGLNSHGQPYKIASKAALRNIQKAQAERRRREALERRNGLPIKAQARSKRRKRFQPYVYPLPQDTTNEAAFAPQTATAAEMEPAKPWVHAGLHHCPNCGEKLTAWKKE